MDWIIQLQRPDLALPIRLPQKKSKMCLCCVSAASLSYELSAHGINCYLLSYHLEVKHSSGHLKYTVVTDSDCMLVTLGIIYIGELITLMKVAFTQMHCVSRPKVH